MILSMTKQLILGCFDLHKHNATLGIGKNESQVSLSYWKQSWTLLPSTIGGYPYATWLPISLTASVPSSGYPFRSNYAKQI